MARVENCGFWKPSSATELNGEVSNDWEVEDIVSGGSKEGSNLEDEASPYCVISSICSPDLKGGLVEIIFGYDSCRWFSILFVLWTDFDFCLPLELCVLDNVIGLVSVEFTFTSPSNSVQQLHGDVTDISACIFSKVVL